MLADSDMLHAMISCDRVRSACPVRFLQVIPDPHCADNVQVRIGQGPYTTMHTSDALAYVRSAYRKQRRQTRKATK
jgi:hypothetical protein